MKQIDISETAYITDELAYLRANYRAYAAQAAGLERYALLTTAVLWSWCVANSSSEAVDVLQWIPLIVTALFGIRALGIHRHMIYHQQYMRKLESATDLPQELGWERHMERKKYPLHVVTGYLFWSILQVFTITMPLVY